MNRYIRRFLDIKLTLNKADNTKVNYEVDLRLFENYMREKLGTEDWFEKITNDDIEDYIVHMTKVKYTRGNEDHSYSNSTINRRIASLNSFFGYAVDKGWIEKNPCAGIELLKVYKEKKDYLTLEEVVLMLDKTYEKAKGERNFHYNSARDRFIISMLTTTGLRVSELINMRFSKMEEVEGGYMINIDAIDTKNDVNKRVPIANKTLKYFNEYIEERKKLSKVVDDDNIILSKSGKVLRRDAVQEVIDKLMMKSGIEEKHITPHSFRHACTTYLRANGVNDSLIYNILGWKEGIVQVYTDDFRLDREKIAVCNLI